MLVADTVNIGLLIYIPKSHMLRAQRCIFEETSRTCVAINLRLSADRVC